jgi:plastocyanin
VAVTAHPARVTDNRHLNESGPPFVFSSINPYPVAICVTATATFAFSLASCGKDAATRSTNAPKSVASSTTTDEVVVLGYKFPPITAAAGSTLKLTSRDDEPHTVTADNGSFDAGPFNPSLPTTLTVPTTPGSYPFHCKVHPTMHGTLVVQ